MKKSKQIILYGVAFLVIVIIDFILQRIMSGIINNIVQMILIGLVNGIMVFIFERSIRGRLA